jgi:hypothetical protein
MDEQEAITFLIKSAVAAPDGHLRLANAEEFIIGELERNRFNTERAIEVYTFAIDNSVWARVKEKDFGRLLFREYLRSGLGKKTAIDLTEKFKARSPFKPLEDQRPPRRFLRFLLGA